MNTSCGSGKNTAYTGPDRKTQVSKKVKEYTKAGWQVHGTAHTLEGKLYEHYSQLENNSELVEITGTATNVSSVNLARMAAINNAAIQYATITSSHIRGCTLADFKLDQISGEEKEKFLATFGNYVVNAVKSSMKESFSLIQRKPDGKNNYEMFFLVDDKEAKKIREDAFRKASEENTWMIANDARYTKCLQENPYPKK